jgi:hypothetical protein
VHETTKGGPAVVFAGNLVRAFEEAIFVAIFAKFARDALALKGTEDLAGSERCDEVLLELLEMVF